LAHVQPFAACVAIALSMSRLSGRDVANVESQKASGSDTIEVDRQPQAEVFIYGSTRSDQHKPDEEAEADLSSKIGTALDRSLASGELFGAAALTAQKNQFMRQRLGPGQRGPPPRVNHTLPPLSPQALVEGTRTAQQTAQFACRGSPSMHKRSRSATAPNKWGRYDPAKLDERRPDGRINMKGVRGTSDVSLYGQFDPFSKKAFDVRRDFKVRQLRETASPALKTWHAVNSWYASSKSFDDFITEAKTGTRVPGWTGTRFPQHRVQNMGGQLATSGQLFR